MDKNFWFLKFKLVLIKWKFGWLLEPRNLIWFILKLCYFYFGINDNFDVNNFKSRIKFGGTINKKIKIRKRKNLSFRRSRRINLIR